MPAALRKPRRAPPAPDSARRRTGGMRLAGERDHAGHHDIGVADARSEPVWRRNHHPLALQRREHAADLGLAAAHPDLGWLLPQHPFVQQADRLVGKPAGQRADLQATPPLRPVARDHRFVGSDQLVEIVEDRRALEQRLAVVAHQCRHPPQRIEQRDLVGIGEGRPRAMLERQVIEPQRNRDAADKGRVVLADQDHGLCVLVVCGILAYSAQAGYPSAACSRHSSSQRVARIR